MKQVKIYIDTEFKEVSIGDKSTGQVCTQPLSVGLYIPSQTNLSQQYSLHYAVVNDEYDTGVLWLNGNVIPKLRDFLVKQIWSGGILSNEKPANFIYNLMQRHQIDDVIFISDIAGSDSVVLSQFFGGYFGKESISKIDTIDLYSIAYAQGILDEVKAYRKSLIDERFIHNALFDAKLVYEIDKKFYCHDILTKEEFSRNSCFRVYSESQNMREKQNRLILELENLSQSLVDYGYDNTDWSAWLNGEFYIPA